jgi:hypothetical protein
MTTFVLVWPPCSVCPVLADLASWLLQTDLLRLSFSNYLNPAVLSLPSCSDCLALSFYLGCHVPAVLAVRLSCRGFPVPVELSQLLGSYGRFRVILFFLSCKLTCQVGLSGQTCPSHRVPDFLFRMSLVAVLPRLSCPSCAHCPRYPMHAGRSVLSFLSWLSCPLLLSCPS